MDKIKVEITTEDISKSLRLITDDAIKVCLEAHKSTIRGQISEYFDKGVYTKHKSKFEDSLDWAVEQSFRQGLTKAMEEIKFDEFISGKCKEILSDNDFVAKLAEDKIRASLGL